VQLQILGSKFWALGGLNQKSKNTVLYSATWRNDGQKWLDSIEKQKRRIDLKEQRDRHTHRRSDGHTDRQSQRQKNNRLLARRGYQDTTTLTLDPIKIALSPDVLYYPDVLVINVGLNVLPHVQKMSRLSYMTHQQLSVSPWAAEALYALRPASVIRVK